MTKTIKIRDTTAGLGEAYLPLEAVVVESGYPNIELGAGLEAVYSGVPFGAGFTMGTEAGQVINVAIQLKDMNAQDLAVRGSVLGYLSNDIYGNSICTTAPNGGVAIGTDGLLVPVPQTLQNAIVVDGNLAVSETVEQFKTTQTAAYVLNGVSHIKAAIDALTFTLNHVISANKFGVVLIQINAAGTISTKVPLATQAYNDAPTALAALPAADAGNIALGYIAIANDAGAWTANTDSLTDDVTSAAFTDTTEASLGVVPKMFQLVSESDGDIDINITETGTPTFYLVLVLPNGKLAASGAITFA